MQDIHGSQRFLPGRQRQVQRRIPHQQHHHQQQQFIQYAPVGMVHGHPVVYEGCEQAVMYQHPFLQPMPAPYGYPAMQAGLQYYVITPQQVEWHPAQQVQTPLTQAGNEKEKVLTPPNPDYAMYAFKKPFGSIEGGKIYEAPSYDLKASQKDQDSSAYAASGFQESVPLDGIVYETPRFL